jgi:hypothetical protein
MTTFKQQINADLEQILFNTNEFAEVATHVSGTVSTTIAVMVEEGQGLAENGQVSEAVIHGMVHQVADPRLDDTITVNGNAWRVLEPMSRSGGVWRVRAVRNERFRFG